MRARWERDHLGRPIRHELHAGAGLRFSKTYVWETNDRLRAVVDALKGPIAFVFLNSAFEVWPSREEVPATAA